MAASTFVPVSLDPPLVLVCVRSGSATWPRLRFSGRLGISVLAGGHEPACRSLSGKRDDRFQDVAWSADSGGAVFIDEAVAWLACRVHDELPAGDHIIALLRILGVRAGRDSEPILFHLAASASSPLPRHRHGYREEPVGVGHLGPAETGPAETGVGKPADAVRQAHSR
jgi:flavin reductase (DIM6/NTAB) family NADH-FMN oxidoreductase RutF